MALSKRITRNRLNTGKMRKHFDSKMECLNHRLKKWSKIFNTPVFTFKTKDKYDPSLDVMPVEKYFDYLLDIHVTHTDHGGVEKMMEIIKEEGLWIPYEAVYTFHKFCSSCFFLQKIEFRRYNTRYKTNQALNAAHENNSFLRGFVEIIDMRSKPDGEYQFILYYKDLSTQFSRLRPLKNPVASEVADELFQIFMTSGAPAVLHAPVKRAFTAAIIKNLEPLMPDIKILVGNPKAPCKKLDKIQTLVDKWMEISKNNNWSFGIYYVESSMNTKREKKNMSAYETMFVRTPGTGLLKRFSNAASRTLLKKLKNEEDLLLPTVEKYMVGCGEDLEVKSSADVKEIRDEWCAICGNDAADSICDICGVAMHIRCNDEQQQLCDCCCKFTANHDHSKVRKYVLLRSNIARGTHTQSNIIDKTGKQFINSDKTKAKAAKIHKTPAKPERVFEVPEIPANFSSGGQSIDVAEVPKSDGTLKNVASTSSEPNKTSIVEMKNDKIIELKVNKIIRQYGKRKKPLATQPSAIIKTVTESEESKDNIKKQKTVDLKDDGTVGVKNDTDEDQDNTVNVENNIVNVKTEAVDVRDEAVDVRDEAVDVRDEAVDVRDEAVDDNFVVKQEIDTDFENINVFDKVLDIVKKDPF